MLKTSSSWDDKQIVYPDGRVKLVVFYTCAFGKVLTINRPEFTLPASALQEAVKKGETR